MAGLWLHECGHILNKHGRRRGRRDPRRWNHAGDLAINPAVRDMGAELPPGGFWPADFGWPEHESADVYYTLLEKKDQQGGGSGQGQRQQGQGQGAQGTSPGRQPGGRGKGRGQPQQDPGQGEGGGEGQEAPHPGHGWCGSCAGRPVPGEPEEGDPEGRGESEQDRAVKEVLEAVKEAAQKGRGNVPLGLARLAEEALQPPKVPWRQKLGRAVRSAASWAAGAVDHRYDAPSRRQAGVGYGPGRPVLPRFRRPVPRVAVAVDTSGSMGTDELTRAVSETEGILKALGASVDLCVCDAEVHGLTKVSNTQEVLRSLKGGGGTYFQPVFDALDRLKPRPEVVVFLTDGGCFDKPREPKGMKVIWVLVGEHREAPPVDFGEFIEVDEE
jgi:predicted metal-dependent peptidase